MPPNKLSRERFYARGLQVAPEQPPVAPEPEPSPDSPYAEDRELVEICVVWSLPDALRLQTLLDRAGIPFFKGAEKATGVDSVTSNFADGVSVRVMRVRIPWALQAMRDHEPANEPPQAQGEKWREIPVRCPKCHSTDVVFERLIPEPQTSTEGSTSKYEWTRDSCGHHWEDEGVVTQTLSHVHGMAMRCLSTSELCSALNQLPERNPSSLTPFSRLIPAANSGLSNPE
jgi:hypothetical protein